MISLGENIYQVDVNYQGEPERTSCYIILAEKAAIFETGATPGIGRLVEALKDLGVPPGQLAYIIVSHIHLDHSGGAGALAREFPNARVLVHPRGARHLVEPSRLINAARQLYGASFDVLFGDIYPVPEERIHTPEEGEALDLGGGRVLTIYHTPGHARHHMVLHDPASRGIFSGDCLGGHYPLLSRLIGRPYVLPITPPSEFDPAAFMETFNRLNRLDLEDVYFTHFGKVAGASEVIARNRDLVRVYAETGRHMLASGGGLKDIEEALWSMLWGELSQYGEFKQEQSIIELLATDMGLNAGGIVNYFERMKKR
ncbi:MBL fold metallo-hydrolase [Pelotomaculum schinkii]|uniref:MBL fold metallo-hydrolase n=1 Tax=Pelotomaculum schinkii TaxID=78350 RepID=UPI001FA9D355|nr:MBL fold metallo-hydrolase [Pelotomaculum schinkii]